MEHSYYPNVAMRYSLISVLTIILAALCYSVRAQETPLSYNIVKRHGGQMDIKSRVGIGTTVTVRLPAVEEAKDA